MSNPLFEIVIPNWNGRALLKACLDSLRLQTFQDFRITVVDNGSSDGSVAFLRASFPEVRCIANSTNTGFSAAVNAGIRAAAGPWILLLNNDMEVAPDCLQSLAEAVDNFEGYAFFALKMVNFHERDYLDGAGEAYLRGGAGYRIGTMEKDGGRYNDDRDCFGACGGAALYHRSTFERIGFFDEEFFAYLEDVDMNLRAARCGLTCRYLAGAVIYHIGSATTGSKFNETTIRLSTRNSLFVLAKNYSNRLLLRFFLPICIYQFMWFCFCAKKGMMAPYFAGMKDGLKNFPGFRRKGNSIRKIHADMLVGENDFAGVIVAAENEAVRSIMNRRTENHKGNRLLQMYLALFG